VSVSVGSGGGVRVGVAVGAPPSFVGVGQYPVKLVLKENSFEAGPRVVPEMGMTLQK
jgi:hypothetical protein